MWCIHLLRKGFLKRELRHQRHKSHKMHLQSSAVYIHYIMWIHNGNISYQLKFISEQSLRETFGSCLLLKENDCSKLMVCLRYSITGSCVSGYFAWNTNDLSCRIDSLVLREVFWHLFAFACVVMERLLCVQTQSVFSTMLQCTFYSTGIIVASSSTLLHTHISFIFKG